MIIRACTFLHSRKKSSQAMWWRKRRCQNICARTQKNTANSVVAFVRLSLSFLAIFSILINWKWMNERPNEWQIWMKHPEINDFNSEKRKQKWRLFSTNLFSTPFTEVFAATRKGEKSVSLATKPESLLYKKMVYHVYRYTSFYIGNPLLSSFSPLPH